MVILAVDYTNYIVVPATRILARVNVSDWRLQRSCYHSDIYTRATSPGLHLLEEVHRLLLSGVEGV